MDPKMINVLRVPMPVVTQSKAYHVRKKEKKFLKIIIMVKPSMAM